MTGNSLGLELSGGSLSDNTATYEKDKLKSLFACLALLIKSPDESRNHNNPHIYCTRMRLRRPRFLPIFILLRKHYSSLRYIVGIC